MNTLKELVYDIWQAVHVEVTDDTFLDERDIEFFIHNRRAMWLRNQLSRGRVFGDSVKQTMSVPLINTTAPKGYAKISQSNVPSLIEVKTKPLLNRAYFNGVLAYPINVATYADIPYLGSGKFNTNEIFVLLIDTKIYVVSNMSLAEYNSLTMDIVARNPTEVPGYTEDSIYPLPDGVWAYIKGDILQYDIAPMLRINKDIDKPKPEEDNNEGEDKG